MNNWFYKPISEPNKTITNPITPMIKTPIETTLASSLYSGKSGFLDTFNTLLLSLINLLKLSCTFILNTQNKKTMKKS